MAQTKRKRTRKHRGTPAGTIERAGRTGRPRTREEAKKISRAARYDRPPSWRSAINRAAVAALVFGVLVVLLFKRDIAQGAALAGFMFLLYIPLGYTTDLMIYRFRQRKKQNPAK